MSKFSKEGKLVILITACLSIGFILGQESIKKSLSIESMKEAFLFNAHTSYLRGCVENSQRGQWINCVQGAQRSTQDIRDIINQDPSPMFHAPIPKPETGAIKPHQPSLEEMIKKQKAVVI